MARALGDRLAHLHLADGLGSSKDEHLVPGRGAQPCAEVLGQLAEWSWSGTVTVEVNTRKCRTRAEREAELAECLAFARLHLAAPPLTTSGAARRSGDPAGESRQPARRCATNGGSGAGARGRPAGRRGHPRDDPPRRAHASSPPAGTTGRRCAASRAPPASTRGWCTTTSTAARRRSSSPPWTSRCGRRTSSPPSSQPGPEGVGERLVRTFLGIWDHPEGRTRIVAILGAAVVNEAGARMIREFITRELLGRIATELAVDRPELRATLAASHLVGIAMVRIVIGVEPLASADTEEIVAIVAPTIQRYLTGED